MGSKQAQKGLISLVSAYPLVQDHFWKKICDHFLTHFWSQSGTFSKHFGIFHGPKRVTRSSKWAKNICLSIPNDLGSLLEQHIFDPFLTHFWSQTSHFQGILGCPMGQNLSALTFFFAFSTPKIGKVRFGVSKQVTIDKHTYHEPRPWWHFMTMLCCSTCVELISLLWFSIVSSGLRHVLLDLACPK